MNENKYYKLHVGDIITISEPYMSFLLANVKQIRTQKFNLFRPSTWKKLRYYQIMVRTLND